MGSISEQPHSPHSFGDLAFDMGLITAEQLAEARRKQASLRATGAKSRLGEVLIMMNVLSVEQVKKVLSEQRKRRQAEADKQIPYEHFGDYKLLERLGDGGMGTVYKATEILAERSVALKVLKKQHASMPGFVERFEREAKMAGMLNHPNIVSCYNSGTYRGVQFLVMEFIEGETLNKRLKRDGGKMAEKEALSIFAEITKGLVHAHEKGVVHRDIKPDNVLLGKDGGIKLSDFGTAKSFLDEDSVSRTGLIVGTPYYIAPEQVRAEKDIDNRADLYALGSSMYEVMTGKVPFDAPTPLQIMRRHLQDDLENPRDINPEISIGAVQIIAKLMAKDREERYQSAENVLEDLERVLHGEDPLSATLAQNKSSIRPPVRRFKKKGGAGCMGVVVLAILLTIVSLWAI